MRAVHWVVLVVVLGVTALVLHSMGRPWWCKAGDLVPWSIDIHTRHNSQHLADPYTVTHAMHGIILYGALWLALGGVAGPTTRATLALGVETAWEIIENTVWVSVASVVVGDALLMVLMRDGLLLNVLMLIHPIEAVKTWQQGG